VDRIEWASVVREVKAKLKCCSAKEEVVVASYAMVCLMKLISIIC